MAIHIIGITGPSGAGKSMFSSMLRNYGITCIDADALYHSMLIPPSRCLSRIAEVFGTNVLQEDGTLNRSALSAIVFQSPERLSLLNQTVLPLVIERIRELIAEAENHGERYFAVDAPTLIESGFAEECHTIIAVVASKEIRVQRIMQRDHISISKATERVAAQKPTDFYANRAHYILENDLDQTEFTKQAQAVIQRILYAE